MNFRPFGLIVALTLLMCVSSHRMAYSQSTPSPYTPTASASTTDSLTMKVAGSVSWTAGNTAAAAAKIKYYKIDPTDGHRIFKFDETVSLVSAGTANTMKIPDGTSYTPGEAGEFIAEVEYRSATGTALSSDTTNTVELIEPAPPDNG